MSMDYSGTPGEYTYSQNANGKSASGIIANGSTSERDRVVRFFHHGDADRSVRHDHLL